METVSTTINKQAAIDFGLLVKAWFQQNDWPQALPHDWAKANGSTIGPWSSQISHCMNGKHEPKPNFFVAMHAFNLAVAENNPGPVEPREAYRIKAGDALRRPDGTPLTIGDWFELYVGAQTPNLLTMLVKHRRPLV